jgi:hypothetical protein
METKNWSIHVEFIVIFFTLVSGIYMARQDTAAQTERIDQVNTRTDQLYTMFYDLIKETKR